MTVWIIEMLVKGQYVPTTTVYLSGKEASGLRMVAEMNKLDPDPKAGGCRLAKYVRAE